MDNKILNKIEFKTLLEHLPTGVIIHNLDTSIEYANRMALSLFKMTWNQVIGKDTFNKNWDLLDNEGNKLDETKHPVNIVINTEEDLNEYIIGINIDNTITWVVVNAYMNKGEKESFIVVTFTDITQSHQISFKEIVDKAKDVVIITTSEPLDEPNGPKIVYVNEAFSKISGYSKEEVLGKTPRLLQKDETSRESLKNIKDALIKKDPVRETLLNFDKSGNPYWLDVSIFPLHGYANKVTHFAAIERDISEIKESELLNIEASRTDHLTSLLNRRGFDSLIVKSFSINKGKEYSIITMDIDNFKVINDTYGHDIGDVVLVEISKVLLNICRKDDICARMGGEEFTIFLPNVDVNQCKVIAERIRLEVSQITIKSIDKSFNFTVSLGIISEKDQHNYLKALKNADKALYEAKTSGKNKVTIFNSSLK